MVGRERRKECVGGWVEGREGGEGERRGVCVFGGRGAGEQGRKARGGVGPGWAGGAYVCVFGGRGAGEKGEGWRGAGRERGRREGSKGREGWGGGGVREGRREEEGGLVADCITKSNAI